MTTHFGATLRMLRIDAGLGLGELAARIGVSSAYLSRVEHGHDPVPTHDRVIAIAQALELPPIVLLEIAQGAGADEARIPRLKQLFVEAVSEVESTRGLRGRIGILCDDRYGQDALNAATGRGWWIGRPVELPGSNPVVFDHQTLSPLGSTSLNSRLLGGASPRMRNENS